MMDTPLHPATVHFPIAFFSLAWVLDIVYYISAKANLPIITSALKTSVPDVCRASHYLTILGLLSALPAISTGAQQLLVMVNNGQAYYTDKTMKPKFKLTVIHAGLNDVTLFASAYGWWIRRNAVGYIPSGRAVLVSAMCLPVLLFSAHLGGKLVYKHGMGVNVAKAAREKKN